MDAIDKRAFFAGGGAFLVHLLLLIGIGFLTIRDQNVLAKNKAKHSPKSKPMRFVYVPDKPDPDTPKSDPKQWPDANRKGASPDYARTGKRALGSTHR